MTNVIHPVLLCGGSGTRLWHLSRKSHPKQFVKLLARRASSRPPRTAFLVPASPRHLS